MVDARSEQGSAQRKIDELIARLGGWRGERLTRVLRLLMGKSAIAAEADDKVRHAAVPAAPSNHFPA